jgi:hypothetical protein
VAILGAGGQYRTPAALARGCRGLGHTARVFDVPAWIRRLGRLAPPFIRRRVEAFEPDAVLLTVDSATLGPPTLEKLTARYPTSFWNFDAQRPPTPKAVMVARAVRRTFTTYLPLVQEFHAAGAGEVHFLPQGVDPEIDRPANEVPGCFRCEVCFIGSGQYRHRVELLRAIAAVAALQIRGPGWASDSLPIAGGKTLGPEFARAVAGADIVLGVNAFAEQAMYRASASNRMWKVFGCRGFYLGPWVEDIDHFAGDGEHCVWYRSTEQAVDLVRRYLADPDARRRISAAGHRHALAHHTYAHRLRLLLAGTGYTMV